MPAKRVPSSSLVKVVTAMRVKYKDIFDMKAFYEALYEWFKEHEWKDMDDNFEHWETYYGERSDAKGAREIWIMWRLYKMPQESTMLRYYLDLDFHCIALVNTEIVREGMKLAANKGEVELTTNAFIEKIYEEKFSQNPVLKLFAALFTQRIYRRELKQREKELYQEAYALQNFIKQWFKLKRYLPYEEARSFFPSYAWPSHMKE